MPWSCGELQALVALIALQATPLGGNVWVNGWGWDLEPLPFPYGRGSTHGTILG